MKWSYSKLKAFDTCHRQYYYERVLYAYPRQETQATKLGTDFHSAAEAYIRDGTPLPLQFAHIERVLAPLRDKPGVKHCEYKMGLTKDLRPCAIDDADVWFTGIADLIIVDGDTASVIDYKTSASSKYADVGQLELMFLAVIRHFPQVTKVRAGLLFVMANAFVREVYRTEDAPALWQKWLAKYRQLEMAYLSDVWNPKPSGLCRKHCRVQECEHMGVR